MSLELSWTISLQLKREEPVRSYVSLLLNHLLISLCLLDWQLSLGIQDRSYLASGRERSGLRVKFFKQETQLPKITGIGDIILLRQIKRTSFNGAPILTSSWNTQASVFPANTIPDDNFKAAFGSSHLVIPHIDMPGRIPKRPSDEEQLYIIDLYKWATEVIDLSAQITTAPAVRPTNIAPRGQPTTSRTKFRLLKDVSENAYYDLVGEVVKLWRTDLYTTMYWTDYTPNKLVQPITTGNEAIEKDRDGDPYGFTSDIRSRKEWTGPTGQLCLQIFLWPPHSHWASHNVSEGDIVFIRNVRIGTRNNDKYLRADLNEDQRHPEQIDVRKMNTSDQRYRDLMDRRERYWAQKEIHSEKRLSKREKKKRKKEKERAEKNTAAGQQNQQTASDADESDDALPHKKPAVQRASNSNSKSIILAFDHGGLSCPPVTCRNPEQPLITVGNVLDTPHRAYATPRGQPLQLPFINQNCRVRVRVVDFWPAKLEDFARPVSESALSCTQSQSQDYSLASTAPPTWEWVFGLLVEDAEAPPPGQKPAQMNLIVSGKDADFLLKLDATE